MEFAAHRDPRVGEGEALRSAGGDHLDPREPALRAEGRVEGEGGRPRSGLRPAGDGSGVVFGVAWCGGAWSRHGLAWCGVDALQLS